MIDLRKFPPPQKILRFYKQNGASGEHFSILRGSLIFENLTLKLYWVILKKKTGPILATVVFFSGEPQQARNRDFCTLTHAVGKSGRDSTCLDQNW